MFWHSGEYGEGEEWQVLLKTSEERYPELEAQLLSEHPRDNPEIGAVDIVAGSPGHLDWLGKSTAKR